MKKNILLILASTVLVAGANAQIGGGLLDKVKSKKSNEKSGDTPSSTPSSSSGNNSAAKADNGKGAINKEVPTNDLKKIIGDNDLYYSALIAQNISSKVILPRVDGEDDYSTSYKWLPNAVNVYLDESSGKLEYCYFALVNALADPSNKYVEKITTVNEAFKYKYKGFMWNGKSEYSIFQNLRYDAYPPSFRPFHKNFLGFLKQTDGSIIIFTIPQKAVPADIEKVRYINQVEIGYQPSAADFDFDAIEVEVLTKTEDAAKTADMAAAKNTAKDMAKKALEDRDKVNKDKADKKVAATTRRKRGMVNAAYEKTMLTWLQENFKTEFKYDDYWKNATIGSLIIASPDWEIKKNDIGLITYRNISCEVVIKNNGRCYVKSYLFGQQYTGGGNYSSSLEYSGYSSEVEQISCDKAK